MLIDTAHLLILGSFFELKVRIIHEKIWYMVVTDIVDTLHYLQSSHISLNMDDN